MTRAFSRAALGSRVLPPPFCSKSSGGRSYRGGGGADFTVLPPAGRAGIDTGSVTAGSFSATTFLRRSKVDGVAGGGTLLPPGGDADRAAVAATIRGAALRDGRTAAEDAGGSPASTGIRKRAARPSTAARLPRIRASIRASG